jgi:type III secretion protein Q
MNTMHAAPTADLASRLSPVTATEARLARTAFDRRFARWVDQVLSGTGTRVIATQGAAGVAAVLSCRHGEFELTAPSAAWPALEMAAELPEQGLARDVADALLAQPLAQLASWLPGLTLRSLQPRPAQAARLELRSGDLRVGLRGLDEGVARQLGNQMRRAVPADLSPLRGLRLPAQLRLFNRELALADLRSLIAGDVVVGTSRPADERLPCQLSIGLGIFMQANADIDLGGASATLTTAPTLAQAPSDASPLEAGAIGALNVPVSFEIDSARVSLDELASFDAGSVITLDAPVRDAAVRLVCFGQVVGMGRLVAVGDCLGVRIERMGTVAATGEGA